MEYVALENANIGQLRTLLGDIAPTDNFLTINGVLLSTQSRGNMTITSADTLDQPQISPNWLENGDVDLEQAVATFKRIRDIASNCSVITAEITPGPAINTTDAIVSYLRHNMFHLYHGTGTCRYTQHPNEPNFTNGWKRLGKMGISSDKSAVVDSRARVFGVTGLRVVDASAFPLTPPGHPMSSVC